MKNTYYIGLDVHKDSIAIAYALGGSREDATYYGECAGSLPTAERTLRKVAKKLGVKLQELKVCYEAGPTGFVLARRLIKLGVECCLMAPSKTERKVTEPIKTDKRDAKSIAKSFRNGDITPVRIPPALDEAVRDLCRARTDASDALATCKQQLNAFLLRAGITYSQKTKWTDAHMRYLRELPMSYPTQRLVLEEYIQAIDNGMERTARIEERMKEVLQEWQWKPVVLALMACKGFKEVSSMTIISELGDLRRFEHPRKLMAYLGLVPGEYSSGSKRRQGSITKCGNSHARWMMVECAQHYRRAPKVSKELTRRQAGQSKEVKDLSWRMQNRLSKRYSALRARHLIDAKCIIAITREMAAFLWELQNKCNLPIPETSEPTNQG